MRSLLIATAATMIVGVAGACAKPVELWQTTGLKTPESALPDPTATFAYVSNVNGNPSEKDGHGFISKVSLKDGRMLALEWAKGLDAPKGLALANGRLYVSDSLNHRVQIFGPAGEWIYAFGGRGQETGKFLSPSGLCIDPENNCLYVADRGNQRVQIFELLFD